MFIGTLLVIGNSSRVLKYNNPFIDDQQKGFGSFLKWQFTKERPGIYKSEIDKIPVSIMDIKQIKSPGDEPQVTWIGHSTVLIQYNEINILTDPIFSDRCSPFSFAGPRRLIPAAIKIPDLPKIDYVVISHNHYDHLDLQSVKKLGNAPKWIIPSGLKEWFNGQKITNVVELNWWEQFKKDDVLVTSTPAQHWSGRKIIDSFNTLWCSWSIQIGDFKFWFGGDTGYNEFQFNKIGEKLGPFDCAAIPIGAYEPRWFMKNYHVNPREAFQIHSDLKSKWSFGIHWGTFILSDESITSPMLEIQQIPELQKTSKSFEILPIGVTKIFKTQSDFVEIN